MYQVRDEKHFMMFIVYVGNIIQALLIYFDLDSFCKKLITVYSSMSDKSKCYQNSNIHSSLYFYGNNNLIFAFEF
jgi:hypothetical protein